MYVNCYLQDIFLDRTLMKFSNAENILNGQHDNDTSSQIITFSALITV